MEYIVYIIKNFINNKVYIGVTRGTIVDRWRVHYFSMLYNDSRPLYIEMRMYGYENFYIEEIKRVKYQASLIIGKIENAYILKHKSIVPYGYNIKNGSAINKNTKSITSQIQKLLKQNSIKKYKLAILMGINYTHLSSVLNNNCLMTNDFITKINKALGTSFKL